jgi:hypothetical protein
VGETSPTSLARSAIKFFEFWGVFRRANRVRIEDMVAQTPCIGIAEVVDPALHAGVKLCE